MRSVLLAAALALVPSWGQIRVPAAQARAAGDPAPVPRVAAPSADIQQVPRKVFATLEGKFDSSLQELGGADVQLLGGTRGLYLAGYGAVFTTELSLAYPPARTPFHYQISALEIKGLHERKLKHLPLVRQAMRDMIMASGKSLDSVPMEEQIVVSVRLLYLPYEDTSGLPSEIFMKADRKSAITGDIQMEEQ